MKQQEELAKEQFKFKRQANLCLVKNAYIKLEQSQAKEKMSVCSGYDRSGLSQRDGSPKNKWPAKPELTDDSIFNSGDNKTV